MDAATTAEMLERRWNDLAATLVYTMVIVTTRHDDERSGCLVGFTTQVSIEPPRYLVCISEQNRTLTVAQDATHLVVHLVPADQHELATLFGGETGDEIDKFDRCSWHEGPRGLPVLDACPDWFIGAVVRTMSLGDHVGFVLAPVAVQHHGTNRVLTSLDALAIEPGHDP